MDRQTYDLTTFCATLGEIGRLQTISIVPVVAGDSFDLQMPIVVRQSPLRQPLTIDARFDVFGFFVPYRHVLGDDWVTFIESGWDESVTFTAHTLATDVDYLGCGNVSGDIPKWLLYGYNRIFNRWFRVPGSDFAEVADAYEPASTNTRWKQYGLSVAQIPNYTTALYNNEITTADYQIQLPVSGTATLDIQDIDRLKARYKTELDREYFSRRYDEIIKRSFGAKMPTIDADERPELLFKMSKWMAGKNVDGNAEGNLGQVVGKSEQLVNVNMPRKHFSEHGTMWIMATMRYPLLCPDHSHYLVNRANPTYKEIAGDPEVIKREPPIELGDSDINQDITVDVNTFGQVPYAQWYRTQVPTIHKRYAELYGFPFVRDSEINTGTHSDIAYIKSDNYDKVFATKALSHWQAFAKLNLMGHRIVPSALSSIYAGV